MAKNIPPYSPHNSNLEGINVKKSSFEGWKAYAIVTLVFTILAAVSVIAGCYKSSYYFLGCTAVIPATITAMIAKKQSSSVSNSVRTSGISSSTTPSNTTPLPSSTTLTPPETISTANNVTTSEAAASTSTTSSNNPVASSGISTSPPSSSSSVISSNTAPSLIAPADPQEISLSGTYIGNYQKFCEAGGEELYAGNNPNFSLPGTWAVVVFLGKNSYYFNNVSPKCTLKDLLKRLAGILLLEYTEIGICNYNENTTVGNLKINYHTKRLNIYIKKPIDQV